MTVEELEPRLTMRGLLEWQEFEDEFGPLTVHERIDGLIRVFLAVNGQDPPRRLWQRPARWTDEQIWAWLDSESKRPH